jgi:hypothetical protein
MQEVQFDSFGEPVKTDEGRAAIPQGSVSNWITYAGTGLFWFLVIVIILARAAYLDPDFAGKFSQLEAPSQTIFGA